MRISYISNQYKRSLKTAVLNDSKENQANKAANKIRQLVQHRKKELKEERKR